MLIVHLFVSYAHVNLSHIFSSSWCRGLAAASACGSSWTILFTFMHTLICVTFSLPPGIGGWLRLLLVDLPGLFCLPFCLHFSENFSSGLLIYSQG